MTAFDTLHGLTGPFAVTDDPGDGLVELGTWLLAQGYRFVTVTPETHRIVHSRRGISNGFDLRDIFGWSRTFTEDIVPLEVRALLDRSHAIAASGTRCASRVRFSTIGDAILMHSAYPASDADSVFFGPDTYRYIQFVHRHLPSCGRARRIIDVGCGSGAAGLSAASALPGSTLVLADINAKALAYARVNARLATMPSAAFALSDVLDDVAGAFDFIIANPPYMKNALKGTFRDGGNHHGTHLSVRIVYECLSRLSGGGRLVLYTLAPVMEGVDLFFASVSACLREVHCSFTYTEIDPDVFGEELRGADYARVERIAAVGLVVDLP
ncbi:methyltransferase [Dokdonella sp. MW10]|uniref:methyltransferase n=1 Tax=Dokdonella sp. MW10 TaxID=2992926 RepID=UPI003F807E49